ncbi:MAG TPA: DNA polymerase III subunit beta, partial [Mycobacteriales bacterium]|nr:DNA polymerase III subunit beta [Mycobacteriales bacterium]
RYRLAVRTLAWTPQTSDVSVTSLVPARTLAETAKALAGSQLVTIALAAGGAGEGMIGLSGGGGDATNRRTTSRLLEGEFPKYRSLLPSESSAVAEVGTLPLVEAVRRVALVAARNAPVRLSFSAEGVILEAGGGDDAQASERLDCEWRADTSEAMQIAFNPTYLQEGLAAVDSDVTVLSFTGATRPAVLTGKSGSDDLAAYRYLLMPVRLSG